MLIVTPHPLIAGTVICCRPVGVLKMADEAGDDAKILSVPVRRVTRIYEDVQEVGDLPQTLVNSIEHFFAHYKDLEEGKWVKIEGWGDAAMARQLVSRALK